MLIENEVSKTLFISLYMKAKESRRSDAFFRDDVACGIIDQVDFDFSNFDNALTSQIGCTLRALYFDGLAIKFIKQNPKAVIVNVGCGLDSRYQRVRAQSEIPHSVLFYEFDLPEVMSLRRQFMTESVQNKFIEGSLFDAEWLEEIQQNHPHAPILFLFEGVLIYFDKVFVKKAVAQIGDYFPLCELGFDISSSWMCKNSQSHSVIKHTKTEFKLSIDDLGEVKAWHDNMQILEIMHYPDFPQWRLTGFWIYWFMSFIPSRKTAFRLLHCRIGTVE